MKGKANIFELHKDGKCVMKGTSKELGAKLGLRQNTVYRAYQEGYNCQGYVVLLAGQGEPNPKDWRITPKMWQQWDDECMKFRRAYAQRRKNGK